MGRTYVLQEGNSFRPRGHVLYKAVWLVNILLDAFVVRPLPMLHGTGCWYTGCVYAMAYDALREWHVLTA